MEIGEFLGTLQQSYVEAWKLHLYSDDGYEHTSIQEYYETVYGYIDELIENYISLSGIKPIFANLYIVNDENYPPIEYFCNLRQLIRVGRILFNEYPEMLSIIDNIMSIVNKTIYKLNELVDNNKEDYDTDNDVMPLSVFVKNNMEN